VIVSQHSHKMGDRLPLQQPAFLIRPRRGPKATSFGLSTAPARKSVRLLKGGAQSIAKPANLYGRGSECSIDAAFGPWPANDCVAF
jgi:hypothetical protein